MSPVKKKEVITQDYGLLTSLDLLVITLYQLLTGHRMFRYNVPHHELQRYKTHFQSLVVHSHLPLKSIQKISSLPPLVTSSPPLKE